MTFNNNPFNFKLASLCTTIYIPSSNPAKISAKDEDEGDDEDEGEDEDEGDDEDEGKHPYDCDPSSGDCFDNHNGSMRTSTNNQIYCTIGFLFISTFLGLG